MLSSNPWEFKPQKKSYPLGDIQRILSQSTNYAFYCENNIENPFIEEYVIDNSDNKYMKYIQEGLKLVEANKNLSDISSEFEGISHFTRYNKLLSENSIIGKINIIDNLDNIISKLSKLNFNEGKSMNENKMELNNVVTIDYNKRKQLIKLLKEIKSNESDLKNKEIKLFRDKTDIVDKIIYFDSHNEKIDLVKKQIEDKARYLIEVTKYINELYTNSLLD